MSAPVRIARIRNIRWGNYGYLWRSDEGLALGATGTTPGDGFESILYRHVEEIRQMISNGEPWMSASWTWDAILPEATPEEAALIRLDMLTRQDDQGKVRKEKE